APDSRMSETAKKFGVFIDDLTARQFVVSDFDRFDLIYAMDTSNYNNIISLARNDTDISKVKLILNESHPDQDLSVPDPYYGGDQGFIDVYNLLDETTDIIMKKIILKIEKDASDKKVKERVHQLIDEFYSVPFNKSIRLVIDVDPA
ncbi:MAG TPA: hypothetical protein EYO58_11740, partial [Flavobacteriales bacterium]|nr:hypothetical protein [Flavobacteriales bacterium]